jgi:hypothetical protein
VSLSTLKIPTARVFERLLVPARYKGVFGGRGSGKSHFFGELLVETCQAERGTLAVCIREAQRTLAQSSKRLIETKIAALGLSRRFKVYSDKIETPGEASSSSAACRATPSKRLSPSSSPVLSEQSGSASRSCSANDPRLSGGRGAAVDGFRASLSLLDGPAGRRPI